MIDEMAMERQGRIWAAELNLINIETLKEIRAFLLVRFKSLKRVEISCDRDNYYMQISLKLRWWAKYAISRKKMSMLVKSLVSQYLSAYTIEVFYQ
jgi:hypothetical protein